MKRFRLTVGDVSMHRRALYGFAALWIVFVHVSISFPEGAAFDVLRWLKDAGIAAVDVFVLLSGLGLYRSFRKNPDVRAFYAKRIQRVALPTVLAVLFTSPFYDFRFPKLMTNLLILPYWLGQSAMWFSAFILLMYLVYPLIFHIQRKKPWVLWILFTLSVGAAVIPSVSGSAYWSDCVLGWERIPAFLLGCMLAPWAEDDREIPRWVFPASLSAFIALNLILHPFATRDPFPFFSCCLFLAVCVIIAFTWSARWLCRCGAGRTAYRFLSLCGTASLEFYILFGRLLGILDSMIASPLTLNLTCLLMTIVLSLVLRRLCDFLVQAYRAQKIPENWGND